jgi:demethylmenaquinone methyltransferase/2-methoxy-6-polyprenyl-1,4-benzoquinol methylase
VLDFNRIETSKRASTQVEAALAGFQRFYLRQVVVPAARAVGLEQHYAYLEASLARFASGAEQERMALAAGFAEARHRPLSGGLMGLLELVA